MHLRYLPLPAPQSVQQDVMNVMDLCDVLWNVRKIKFSAGMMTTVRRGDITPRLDK